MMLHRCSRVRIARTRSVMHSWPRTGTATELYHDLLPEWRTSMVRGSGWDPRRWERRRASVGLGRRSSPNGSVICRLCATCLGGAHRVGWLPPDTAEYRPFHHPCHTPDTTFTFIFTFTKLRWTKVFLHAVNGLCL